MRNLTLLFGALFLCAQCTGGSSPSDTKKVQQPDSRETLTPHVRISVQDQNHKHLIKARESAALKVYIDPETGEFITPTEREVSAAKRLETRDVFSTSHDDLVVVPSSVPGGGKMVHLKGRFRSLLTASRDRSGKINIGHYAIEERKER